MSNPSSETDQGPLGTANAGSSHAKLPDFLVIGGMKCATTTLHQDLSQHPQIECGTKELNALTASQLKASAESAIDVARAVYQRNYKSATEGQMLGDISTSYTMLPTHPGIPELALELAGKHLKIIYVVREPIERIVSHHRYMASYVGEGRMGEDINVAVMTHPELLDYSRYALQIKPWIETFGLENICIIRFEDYVAQRAKVIARLCSFLGVEQLELEIDPEGANRTDARRFANRWLLKFWSTDFFQNVIRPLAPAFVVNVGRKLLLRKTKPVSIKPSSETMRRLHRELAPEADAFAKLVNLKAPLWDLSQYGDAKP